MNNFVISGKVADVDVKKVGDTTLARITLSGKVHGSNRVFFQKLDLWGTYADKILENTSLDGQYFLAEGDITQSERQTAEGKRTYLNFRIQNINQITGEDVSVGEKGTMVMDNAINRVFLTGRGYQIKANTTNSGKAVTNGVLAIRTFVPKSDIDTTWIDITAWEEQASYLESLGNGAFLTITGSIFTDTFERRDGTTGYKEYVTISDITGFLSGRDSSSQSSNGDDGNFEPLDEETDFDSLPF